MGNAARHSTTPMDPDYNGSMTDKIMQVMGTDKFIADGDHLKAVAAIHDVVVGKGVGEGHEAERVLPLGRDLAMRVKEVADKWEHTMEVFGEVCTNVYKNKGTAGGAQTIGK
jgi:hypothetical protein